MNNLPGNNISAVILAAGLSSRMKDFKPLLPFGEKTMIEMVISLFKKNNINDIIVVTGHNSSQIQPLIKKASALPVFNQNFKSGMLSSIQKGIKNTQQDNSGFFLLPVDIPAIRPSTIGLMIDKFQKSNTHIILPYFNNKPGHPPLIPSYLGNGILSLKNGSTLRDLLFSQKTKRASLKVHDQGVLMDADNKDQFNKVYGKLKIQHIPDKEECLSIINTVLPEHDSIRTHMAYVSFTALKIANAVTDNLNTDLTIMGFTEVSKIISQHMDIDLNPKIDIKEKEIVYFADKICN